MTHGKKKIKIFTQVRKETAASNFRVVYATAGKKVEIFSEILSV